MSNYVVLHHWKSCVFGPFPSEDKAEAFIGDLKDSSEWHVEPLVAMEDAPEYIYRGNKEALDALNELRSDSMRGSRHPAEVNRLADIVRRELQKRHDTGEI